MLKETSIGGQEQQLKIQSYQGHDFEELKHEHTMSPFAILVALSIHGV